MDHVEVTALEVSGFDGTLLITELEMTSAGEWIPPGNQLNPEFQK